jgi:hypothetical protein
VPLGQCGVFWEKIINTLVFLTATPRKSKKMKSFAPDPYEKVREVVEREGVHGREAVSIFTSLLIEFCIDSGISRKEIVDCLRVGWPKI